MTPLNLKTLYADCYVISRDREAAESARDRSPWLYQIKTRVGVVYPYSDELLGITCDYRPRIAAELARRGLRLHQDGDDEKTFLATPAQFEAVAPLIRPRKRRAVMA